MILSDYCVGSEPAVLEMAACDACIAASDAQVVTLDPGHDHPFGPLLALEAALGSGSPGPLRTGIYGAQSPDNPLPPDAFGPCEALVRTLLARTDTKGLMLVVQQPEAWGADALVAAGYILRRLWRPGVAVIFAAPPGGIVPMCAIRDSMLRATQPELPVCASNPWSGGSGADALCAIGARLAARAALDEGYDAQAPRSAARLALIDGDDARLLEATRVLETRDPTGRDPALARRLRLLACHRRNDSSSAARELAQAAGASVPEEWVALDTALLAAILGDGDVHVAALGQCLDRAEERADPACLATAWIWRGAAEYLAGHFDMAQTAMWHALRLLDHIGEVTRATHVRLRLGKLLAASGEALAAAHIFEVAGDVALGLGDDTNFATALWEAASALEALGSAEQEPARDGPSWRRQRFERAAPSRHLAQRLEAERAIRARDPDRLATAFVHLAESQTGQERFETALLHARAARARHCDPRPSLQVALALAKRLSLEERPLAYLQLESAL